MQNLLLVFIGGGLGAVCRYISTTHIGALFGKTENRACVTYHRAKRMIREGLEDD